MQLKTLTDFRRILSTPGVRINLLENTVREIPKDNPAWRERIVDKLQTNGVYFAVEGFERTIWFEFGKAAEWQFQDDVATRTIPGTGKISFRVSGP